MSAERPLYGLLAEFDHPDELVRAAHRAREQGYRRLDAYTPIPIKDLGEVVGEPGGHLPTVALVGGVLGAGGGMFMQWYANVVSYAINIGGRPLASWPAFVLPAFESGVLGATLFVVGGMLYANGLPRLNHPLFEVDRFHLASEDRFFLCIRADDPRFDTEDTGAFLASCGAGQVHEVPA
jgi:hypothetical protein